MTTRAPLRAPFAGLVAAGLALVVLALDQTAKAAALANLPWQRVVDVIPGVLGLYLTSNSGGAFSLLAGATWIFTIALAGVAVVIVWLLVTRVRSRLWMVVLGLLLGGVLGNLTDRLVRSPGFGVGEVIDYISTPWMMPAIYNVADIFIVTSMIAVALLVLGGLHLDGTRERRRPVDDAQGDDGAVAGPSAQQ